MEIPYRSGGASALWKSGLLPVYLFFGGEDRLKQEAVDALVKKGVSPDFADFDLERMNAAETTSDGILAAAAQVPFGSDRRMIVVKGMEQWRDRNKSAEVERLAEGLGRLGETACLILIAAAEDDEDKRKTAVTVKLDNAVKKIGAVVTCAALKGDSLEGWIRERAAQEGKQIQGDAANQLLRAVGNEMLPLEQEIIKLVCYVGDRATITAKDVAQAVASSPDDVIFSAVDAITRRDTERALSLLSELHRYDPKPQAVAGKLLALLARQYRMLWHGEISGAASASILGDVRALSPELAAELPTESNIAQMAFKAGDLFAASKNYTWGELTGALDRLLLCDLANKGGVTDETGTFGSDPAANLMLLVLGTDAREMMNNDE